MSTHILGPTTGAKTDSNAEQARAAVKAFRSMQPGLSAFARALTGKRAVRVELATGPPRTDGTKIFYRPPIALGLDAKHNRSLCDKRDALTYIMTCPACALREEVLINIYHEISHIAFGSFKATDERDKTQAVERALEEYKGKYADSIRKRVSEAPLLTKDSYLGLATLISQYLPLLVNVLEDLRIEATMFKARKGTRKMFVASITNVMVEGIEGEDGIYTKWNSFPLNHQIVGGLYVMATGINFREHFVPEIVAALEDDVLQGLCKQAVNARSARDTYLLSFPVLARLRELGFCKLPDEEADEDEAEDKDKSDEAGDQAGDGDQSGEEGQSDQKADQPDDNTDQSDDNTDQPDDDTDQPDKEDGSEDDSSDESGCDSDEDDSNSDQGGKSDGDDEQEEKDEETDSDGNDSQDSDNKGDDYGDTELGGSDGTGESESGGGADGEGDSTEADSDSVPETDRHSASEESAGQSGASEPDDTSDGDDTSGSGESEEVDDADDAEDLYKEDDTDSEGDQDSDAQDSDDDSEAVDSGADEGKGGKTLENNPLGMGTPEGLPEKISVFGNHEYIHEAVADAINNTHYADSDKSAEQVAVDKALDIAIIQGLYFETPSLKVSDVRIFEYENQDKYPGTNAWKGMDQDYGYRQTSYAGMREQLGIDCDLDIPETVLGPATMQTRRTFDENRRAKNERNLKSGKIRSQALGRRAWSGDERLFQKKTQPGKRSYAVLIGVDISGSTVGVNIALAKRAAMAQAELCYRADVNFALWCHTTDNTFNRDGTITMDMYKIKDFNESWSSPVKERLAKIGSAAGNLDGHSIEYYRREVEKQDATDKIILYYSDGKMPAANYEEELEILQREIKYCRARGIALMGVGIRTDSPARHGLDTFQVNSDNDLIGVTRHLEKKFLGAR